MILTPVTKLELFCALSSTSVVHCTGGIRSKKEANIMHERTFSWLGNSHLAISSHRTNYRYA